MFDELFAFAGCGMVYKLGGLRGHIAPHNLSNDHILGLAPHNLHIGSSSPEILSLSLYGGGVLPLLRYVPNGASGLAVGDSHFHLYSGDCADSF